MKQASHMVISYSKLKSPGGKRSLIIQRQETGSLLFIVDADSEIRKEVIFILSLDIFQAAPWYTCKPLYTQKRTQFLYSVNWMTNSWMENLSGLWELLIATCWHTRESQQKDNLYFKAMFPKPYSMNNSRNKVLWD